MKNANSALKSALYLLKIRDRSSEEIKSKLKSKGYDNEEIISAIKFLEEKKFVDDKKFAKSLVRSLSQKGFGQIKIKWHLKKYFLSSENIDEALSDIDSEAEKELAINLAEKWLSKKEGLERNKKYQSLGRYLASRGFNPYLINEVWSILKDKQ